MKRIFFIGALLFLSAITFAQTEKGKFLVSGRTSIDFTYSKMKIKESNAASGSDMLSESYNFNISPAVGYFVVDNFATTLQTSYAISDGKTNSEATQFSIMPGVIYYVPTGGAVVRPFIQAGGGYVTISSKIPLSSGGKSTQSFNGYTLAGGIGVAFFVKDNISIDLGGQYAIVRTSYSGDSSVKMNLNGLSGAIGLSLFF